MCCRPPMRTSDSPKTTTPLACSSKELQRVNSDLLVGLTNETPWQKAWIAQTDKLHTDRKSVV